MKKLALLFLCTGNSCRSQMAEGWVRRLWPDRYTAWSAGAASEQEAWFTTAGYGTKSAPGWRTCQNC